MKKLISILIFILSAFSLFISVKLFYNMGLFVDAYNTTPAAVCGGELWSVMDWVRLALNALICVLSLVNIFYRKRNVNF